MIEISNLSKSFGSIDVLKDLSLNIEAGKITYLVGPNGSGKTTFIKSILGLIKNYEGDIKIEGEKINGEYQYRNDIGYMPQNPHLPENLTVKNIFQMVKDIRNESDNLDEELINDFELELEMNKRLKTLSGGTLQKVNASLTFLFNPKLLILDEPTAGLDPIASGYLKNKIRQENSKGKTILFTSHIISELEDLAQNIAFLLEGKLCFYGSINSIMSLTGEKSLERSIANVMLRKVI